MDETTFESEIKAIVSEGEFKEQNHLLEVITPQHRPIYLKALSLGYKMKDAFSALDTVTLLSDALKAKPIEILEQVPHFDSLIELLMPEKYFSSDPVVDAVDLIDKMGSYESLTFLREHMEHRMTVLLKDIMAGSSPAINPAWKKICAACGHTAEMFTEKCKSCGWSPY